MHDVPAPLTCNLICNQEHVPCSLHDLADCSAANMGYNSYDGNRRLGAVLYLSLTLCIKLKQDQAQDILRFE